MVAVNGAGPEPIPYRRLTPENLADAISFCLTKQALDNAQQIADQMRRESGVKAAVQSFHTHLPKDLGCDVLPDRPAVWKYKEGKRTIKLSKEAAVTLSEKGKVSRKSLKL